MDFIQWHQRLARAGMRGAAMPGRSRAAGSDHARYHQGDATRRKEEPVSYTHLDVYKRQGIRGQLPAVLHIDTNWYL